MLSPSSPSTFCERILSKGSYLGGSTVIGAGSSWFSYGKRRAVRKIKGKPNPKAINSAIQRHEEQLLIEKYRALADFLRAKGFSDKEVKRGLHLQRQKDRLADK